jgi:hypothetical protein
MSLLPGRPVRAASLRAPLALVVLVSFALPAAGCGGGSPGADVAQLRSPATQRGPSSNPGTAAAQVTGPLAFSRCMRSNGVTSYSDPTSAGVLPKENPQQLGVSSSQFQAAQRACQRLLANGGQPTPARLQQSWTAFLEFARCMRRHGVPGWPDPTRYPQHPDRPTFDLQSVGIGPSSPQLGRQIHECAPLLGGVNPQHLGQGGA